jgi:hypothetical protein
MKKLSLLLIAFFALGCKDKPDINISNSSHGTSEIGRFQIVGLRDKYPPSNDILVDTMTGETWFLTWTQDKEIGNYLNWQKINLYQKSQLAMRLENLLEETEKSASKASWDTAIKNINRDVPIFEKYNSQIIERIKSDPFFSTQRDRLNNDIENITGREELLKDVYNRIVQEAKGSVETK